MLAWHQSVRRQHQDASPTAVHCTAITGDCLCSTRARLLSKSWAVVHFNQVGRGQLPMMWLQFKTPLRCPSISPPQQPRCQQATLLHRRLWEVSSHCNAASLVSKPTLYEYAQARGGGGVCGRTHALFCQLNRLRMTHECQYNHNIGNPCVEAVFNFHEVTYPQRALANLRVCETTRREKKQSILGLSLCVGVRFSQRYFVAVLLIC